MRASLAARVPSLVVRAETDVTLKIVADGAIIALTYFDDAEADPIFPRGMTPALWEQVRTSFAREGPRLLQELMQPKPR